MSVSMSGRVGSAARPFRHRRMGGGPEPTWVFAFREPEPMDHWFASKTSLWGLVVVRRSFRPATGIAA